MVARTEEQLKQIRIKCDGQLMQVESCEFVGTILLHSVKLQGEMQKRIQKATNPYYSLSHCVIGKEEVDKNMKTKVVLESLFIY